jgi:hypothetical protein
VVASQALVGFCEFSGFWLKLWTARIMPCRRDVASSDAEVFGIWVLLGGDFVFQFITKGWFLSCLTEFKFKRFQFRCMG